MEKQTDEKGNPLTYWGGLEEPNPFELPKALPDDVFFKSLEEPKQQTAVKKAIDLINKDFEENGRLRFAYVQKVLHEAKEMERQQIIKCAIQTMQECFIAVMEEFNQELHFTDEDLLNQKKEAERYYNETFKKK
jgi:hypothetical protein